MYNITNLTFNFTSSVGVQEVTDLCIEAGSLTNYNSIILFTYFVLIILYFYIASLQEFKLKNFTKYSWWIRRILFSVMTLTISLYTVMLYYLFIF